MSMILYDYPDCPYAKKVKIVLAEKELSFETVSVDLSAGQNRQAEFLKLNPFGKVPVLVDEGVVVYDSTIINEYLDDEYPHPQLMPVESGERSRVRVLEDFADIAFTLPVMAVERELSFGSSDRDEKRLDTARGVVEKMLVMLDRELNKKEYLAGEFSLADVAFAPAVLQLDKLGVKVETSLTNVRSWMARLSERPTVGPVIELVA